jgi:hypothetical protein
MKRFNVHRLVTILALSSVLGIMHTSPWTDFDAPAGIRRLKKAIDLAGSIKTVRLEPYLFENGLDL